MANHGHMVANTAVCLNEDTLGPRRGADHGRYYCMHDRP